MKTIFEPLAHKVILRLLETKTGRQKIKDITEARIRWKVDQAVLEAQASEAHKTAEKIVAAIKARNKFETTEKSKHLNAERKLDSRLDVLINVQSELFYMTQDKDPDELTLSWRDVDGVIRREIRKVATEQFATNYRHRQAKHQKQYSQKDASENH